MPNDLVIPIASSDPRLKRNINHDPRSADHRLDTRGLTLVNTEHTFPGQEFILDQGDWGYCTAEAGHYLMWSEMHWSKVQGLTAYPAPLTAEEWGKYFYAEETRGDTYPGTFTYPPEGGQDTGSDGLTSAKVAKSHGLIDSYQHTFTADDALLALTKYPLSWGTLWKSGMDEVNEDTGQIRYSGTTRGGHQMCLYRVDVDNQRVWGKQSWGAWGYQRSGVYWISFDDFARSLADQGDITVYLPRAVPAPPPLPAPVSLDLGLAVALRAWEPNIISRITKAGKVKTAGDAWMAGHGY